MQKGSLILGMLLIFTSIASATEPLNLQKSIEIGLMNNSSVIAAREKVIASEGSLGTARSALLPHLSVSAQYSRQYQSPSTFLFTVNGVSQTVQAGFGEAGNISSYSLSLSQPLFTFGKLLAGLDIATKNREIAIADLRAAEWNTIYQVSEAYYGVLKAFKFVEVAQQSINMAQAHLDQIEAMVRQGISTKADMLRIEVQLSQTNQVLIKANNGREVALSVFNTALGRNIDSAVEIEDLNLNIPAEISWDLETLKSEMFLSNPEWIKFMLTKKISEQNFAIAVKDYLPTFALSGSYGSNNYDYKDLLNYGVNSWSVAAAASWDIFTGFKRPSTIKEAAANLAVIAANADNLKKKLTLDLKQALLEMKSTAAQIKAADKSVELAKENLRLANLKYKSGMGTNIEVIDAQTSLIQSEVDYVSAAYDYLLAKEKINKTVGLKVL